MHESPRSEFTLQDVRSHIDRIDHGIVELIAERQGWVVEAGRLKQDERAVQAPARVEQVVEAVRRIADEVHASPTVVEATYRAMIAAFIDLELDEHRSH